MAMGVIASSKWPSRYAEELKRLALPAYRSGTLSTFGTAQFLWQRLQRPPIGAWVGDLMQKSQAASVVVHFHNAWLSGVFLPIHTDPEERTKTVVTFHGVSTTLEGQPFRRWLHRGMARRLLRYNASLTSVDAGSLPLAERLFGLLPQRFTRVPNGVTADESLGAAQWKGAGDFIVGYVGLLAQHKGWRIVVDSVLRLRARGRKIRLLIVGAGAEEEAARAVAQTHPDSVEFLGHVSSPRKNPMPRMHVLALMSTYEGLPMVLIEAASIGLPVVATNVGGVTEILDDGVTGIVVSRSSQSLAEALDRLYENPALTCRMSEASRARHNDRFEISKVVAMYHSVYLGGSDSRGSCC